MKLLNVVLIGRPNVGKSTLFNRLVGRRKAIVHPTPGVTRDRQIATAQIGGFSCHVVDTPGLEPVENEIVQLTQQQTQEAVQQADLVLLVVDGKSGIIPLDEEYARWLRTQKKPVTVIVNKCDHRESKNTMHEASTFGFESIICVSAAHGLGMGDLIQVIQDSFGIKNSPDTSVAAVSEVSPIRAAIVGRPNVGKSSLLNRLLGQHRLLAGPQAGLTRDSIEIPYPHPLAEFIFIDTAGVKKKSSIQGDLDRLSYFKTLETIKFAEIVGVVIDAELGLHRQDLQLTSHVIEEGRAVVLLVNKWDKIKAKQRKQWLDDFHFRLSKSLAQVPHVPVVTLSAKTGDCVDKIIPTFFKIYQKWNLSISTSQLNQWLEIMQERHPSPTIKGKVFKVKFIKQATARPPSFTLFVNRKIGFPTHHLRFLSHELRKAFDLEGVPMRLFLKTSKNPYISE